MGKPGNKIDFQPIVDSDKSREYVEKIEEMRRYIQECLRKAWSGHIEARKEQHD